MNRVAGPAVGAGEATVSAIRRVAKAAGRHRPRDMGQPAKRWAEGRAPSDVCRCRRRAPRAGLRCAAEALPRRGAWRRRRAFPRQQALGQADVGRRCSVRQSRPGSVERRPHSEARAARPGPRRVRPAALLAKGRPPAEPGSQTSSGAHGRAWRPRRNDLCPSDRPSRRALRHLPLQETPLRLVEASLRPHGQSRPHCKRQREYEALAGGREYQRPAGGQQHQSAVRSRLCGAPASVSGPWGRRVPSRGRGSGFFAGNPGGSLSADRICSANARAQPKGPSRPRRRRARERQLAVTCPRRCRRRGLSAASQSDARPLWLDCQEGRGRAPGAGSRGRNKAFQLSRPERRRRRQSKQRQAAWPSVAVAAQLRQHRRQVQLRRGCGLRSRRCLVGIGLACGCRRRRVRQRSREAAGGGARGAQGGGRRPCSKVRRDGRLRPEQAASEAPERLDEGRERRRNYAPIS